jgi:sensor c-di-GMP phosphodiesterase-like protein
MKSTKERILVTLVVTILAAICGAAGGYLLGGALALRQAKQRLQHDAERLIAEENATLKETYATLKKMSSSPYPYCSEAELAYFRKLLFQTDYLKDSGRMRNGTIDCSATLSTADLPREPMKPEYSMPGGTNVYRETGSLQIRDQPTIGLQFKDLYVVINSGAGRRVDSTTLPFIMTVRPTSSQNPGMLLSTTPEPEDAVFTTEGMARKGKTLYFTRCTPDKLSCMTTHITIPEAIQADQAEMSICIVLGELVGALLGFLVSLVYQRSRGMEHQLRRAISKDKLRLAYQEVLDLASRRIVGAEALARWTDDEGFAVGPDVFIRIAEDGGFVGEITRLVVRHAMIDFAKTLKDDPEFKLSINVAAADLSDPAFLPMLDKELQQAGVPAQSLAIEITESSTALFQAAMETIISLRRRGHSVYIDDFGTGYSSLSYLHSLSIDTIKIDRSFIQAIGTESVTVGILPQILAMAAVLKLDVIVEGVETDEQANYFAGMVPPVLVQGWIFGRPVTVETFLHLLAEDEKKAQAETAAL